MKIYSPYERKWLICERVSEIKVINQVLGSIKRTKKRSDPPG
jgi:hypothetical protein